jgi:hypothetical protein
MPETLATLFEQLRTVGPPAPFAPPSEVRRRGRRRTYRGRLAAGGAALAVGAIGVTPAFVGGGPSPQPTPVPTPTASPSLSPSPAPSRPSGGVLLEPSDLGSGRWVEFEAEMFSNPDRWPSGFCEYDRADYPSLAYQEDVTTVAFQTGTVTVTQAVERYAAGWGARNLDDVRAVIALCDRAGTGVRFTIEPAPGFAGDEVILMREEAPGAEVRFYVIARVGDRVVTVTVYGDDVEYARTVAARAVARL